MAAAGRIDTVIPAARAPTLFARLGNVIPVVLGFLLIAAGIAPGGSDATAPPTYKDFLISEISIAEMRSSYLFTSESVSEGHPDKVADQISDAIVDLFLSKDPEARVACETMTTTNRVVLAGEIRGRGIMDQDGNWAPGVREEIEFDRPRRR